MKVYWADREGKTPPPHSMFHIRPFYAGPVITLSPKFTDLPEPKTYKVLKKTLFPDYENWKLGVEKALELIRKQELEKVVLGRICVMELEKMPDPFAITAALQQKAEGAFVFCTELEHESFLGASPERLFCRHDKVLFSEAIAGTRPRNMDPILNQKLQLELLNSPKDLREFLPVQKYLESALSPLCQSHLDFTPLSIHQTGHVQHLYSRCSGSLKEGVSDDKILMTLHPTPALCGTPTQKAYSLIQDLEPFDRGFFGGAIGWSTPENSEWIVGIRSCHIKGKVATLFSGTGIVEGSDPEEEWEELNQKLKLYDRILAH